MKFTKLELDTMFAMTQDNYWEEGIESTLWADVFASCTADDMGLEMKKVRGTLSSLVKKDIILPIAKGRDGMIRLTEKGQEIFKWLYKDHPDVRL